MFFIKVPDANDSVSRITLDGKEFYIRFTFNPGFQYWSVGLYTKTMEPIMPMTKVVPKFDVWHYYTETEFPAGVLMCHTDLAVIDRQAFKEARAGMLYIPESEWTEELEAVLEL